MIQIEQVDVSSKAQVNAFVQFHYDLYTGTPQWVPPFYDDIRTMLNPSKHPFYEHSVADFFVAKRDGKIVGRIGALENKPFNQWHNKKDAEFYLFDCINDQQVANALFDRAFEWAKARGLDNVVGPKGFSAFDGYGIQIEGYEHRQMMNMMNYNFPYYRELAETYGFEKEVDFVSTYLQREKVHLPEKAKLVAEKVYERGTFTVKNFESKGELKKWAWNIVKAYNNTFINNWEFYPFSERETKFMVDNLLMVVVPQLIKIILHKEQVVGFMFGFPDISEAMQRQKGRITPWGVIDLMRSLKNTNWLSLNGVGILPEYQGRGGNVLMFAEMLKTIEGTKFEHAELTQVAESAVQMRRDLGNLGAKPYKNHRVFHKAV